MNQAESQKSERDWSSFIYLAVLSGAVIPFFNIILPYVLWKMKQGQSALIDRHAKIVLNFQISLTLVVFAGLILMGIFYSIGSVFSLLGYLIYFGIVLLGIANIVLMILGAIKVNKGEDLNLDYGWRFIK